MGRKAKFDEGDVVEKRGPGKKTKKQKAPVFTKSQLAGKSKKNCFVECMLNKIRRLYITQFCKIKKRTK